MTKLCPRGKAAAKRKFKVYPSAYANAYASKICAGKIKDPSGVKRKDFKGRKPAAAGGQIKQSNKNNKKTNSIELIKKRKDSKKEALEKIRKELGMKGGGLMEATARLKRQGLRKGGGADTGKVGELKSKFAVATDRVFRKKQPRGRISEFDMKKILENLGSKRKPAMKGPIGKLAKEKPRRGMMGGGSTRPMYRKGGGVCLRGMNRDAIGKNS